MSNVFFGKMNSPEQVMDKTYITDNMSYLGDIKIGDYAFIKLQNERANSPAMVCRLWILKEIRKSDEIIEAVFDELFTFNEIPLSKFASLDLFRLDINLLNKCHKSTAGISFFELGIVNDWVFEAAVKSAEAFNDYIGNKAHYRRLVKVADRHTAKSDSVNVQFYRENNVWNLVDAPFLGEDLKGKYNADNYDEFDKKGNKNSGTAKAKMFAFLNGASIQDDTLPMIGLWDLFCSERPIHGIKTKQPKATAAKRSDFIEYCKSKGVKGAAAQYEGGIRSIEKEFAVDIDEQYSKDKCTSLKEKIEGYVNGFGEEDIGNRRNWITYLKKYVEYKNDTMSEKTIEVDDGEKVSFLAYDYSQARHGGENKVFYGTPGCGKSYYVENNVVSGEEWDKNNIFRTTFFQDYTNTDFIGQILPRVEGERVTYQFNPGPFTVALKCAIDNPDQNVALIIEELNRGNAPAIFGDIFQLLDRTATGESKYEIVNVNILDYLKREALYKHNYIKIPANLYIYATMNTSDQNVFTLDTAFKRRWKFVKLTNDFTSGDTIRKKYVPGFQQVTWEKFVTEINEFMIDHATTLSVEDKQLGKYFVSEDLLLDDAEEENAEKTREFADKIFEYLWMDVAKFNRDDWFVPEIKSLDMLIYRFTDHDKDIFASKELAYKLPVRAISEEE